MAVIEGNPNPILEKIEQQRRHKTSQEQAKEMVPDFKVMLGRLISTKVSPPEQITRQVTQATLNDDLRLAQQRAQYGNELSTILTISVPQESGEIVVTISASGYPDPAKVGNADYFDYRIDVTEIDTVLVVEDGEARIDSKKRESEPITMMTPIGMPIHTWPASSHPVMVEELQGYEALLGWCQKAEGVTYKGSTPAIITDDWSTVRTRNSNFHRFVL